MGVLIIPLNKKYILLGCGSSNHYFESTIHHQKRHFSIIRTQGCKDVLQSPTKFQNILTKFEYSFQIFI